MWQVDFVFDGDEGLCRGDPAVLAFVRLKKGRAVLSAFLRRHGEEGGGLLVQVFTATLRTLDLVLFVFRKGKEDFKWLLAVFAIELIARHVDLRKRQRGGALLYLYARGTPVSRQVKRTKRASDEAEISVTSETIG